MAIILCCVGMSMKLGKTEKWREGKVERER